MASIEGSISTENSWQAVGSAATTDKVLLVENIGPSASVIYALAASTTPDNSARGHKVFEGRAGALPIALQNGDSLYLKGNQGSLFIVT